MLDFAFFITARDNEAKKLQKLEDENERQVIYNEGYSKGYADGEFAGMKRFAQEHSDAKGKGSNDKSSITEASRV